MLNIPHYQITKIVYENSDSLIYRGTQNKDGLPIILKVLKDDYPSPEKLTRYRQEYDIIRSLETITGVINAYSLEKYQNTLAICLEDFNGQSLKHW